MADVIEEHVSATVPTRTSTSVLGAAPVAVCQVHTGVKLYIDMCIAVLGAAPVCCTRMLRLLAAHVCICAHIDGDLHTADHIDVAQRTAPLAPTCVRAFLARTDSASFTVVGVAMRACARVCVCAHLASALHWPLLALERHSACSASSSVATLCHVLVYVLEYRAACARARAPGGLMPWPRDGG